MDHSKQALKRIYWQYRGAEKLKQWIETLPKIAQAEIEDTATVVADILNIDERRGEQLDIIGRIVGLYRPAINSAAEVSTQMAADDLAPQLGEGGAQLSATTYTITNQASDGLLRVLIKAKIERNNGDATIDNIIDAARFVTGFNDVVVSDNQDMTWSVSFGSELDPITRFAFRNFDILPKPQGTRFLGFIESPSLMQLDASFAQLGDERAQLNEVFI